MKKFLWSLLLVLFLVFFLSTSSLAQKQVLHLYTAFDTEEAKLYIEVFEEETGIDVQWVRMSSGEVLARIEAEASNPQASVWHAEDFWNLINPIQILNYLIYSMLMIGLG